jgi:hypothetical protein
VSHVEESVDVDVPMRTAYDQWTQFESFPEFMEGVESITHVDETHNHWVTKIGGVTREFDTGITEQHPDERIAWKSVDGDTRHAGVVTFHRLSAQGPRREGRRCRRHRRPRGESGHQTLQEVHRGAWYRDRSLARRCRQPELTDRAARGTTRPALATGGRPATVELMPVARVQRL